MGLRGWRRTITNPATAKSTATATFSPPFTSQFWFVRKYSGTEAAARSTVTPAAAIAVTGKASQERRPATCARGADWLTVPASTHLTLRPDHSGNVTAAHAAPGEVSRRSSGTRRDS